MNPLPPFECVSCEFQEHLGKTMRAIAIEEQENPETAMTVEPKNAVSMLTQ